MGVNRGMVKVEDIKNKYAFIYEIGEDYYYIGNGIFEECVLSDDIYRFERYKETVNRIGRDRLLSQALTEEEKENLIYTFRKVKTCSDFRKDKVEKHIPEMEKLGEFLLTLSEDQKKQLMEQLENFIVSFKYYKMRIG